MAVRSTPWRRIRRFASTPPARAVGRIHHASDGPEAAERFLRRILSITRLAFGYVWKRADFPWMGIWEENRSRGYPPWNRGTLARGLEFGVSPFPESRRSMTERGSLFGVPTYRWLPARSRVVVEYWAITQETSAIPESFDLPTGSP